MERERHGKVGGGGWVRKKMNSLNSLNAQWKLHLQPRAADLRDTPFQFSNLTTRCKRCRFSLWVQGWRSEEGIRGQSRRGEQPRALLRALANSLNAQGSGERARKLKGALSDGGWGGLLDNKLIKHACIRGDGRGRGFKWGWGRRRRPCVVFQFCFSFTAAPLILR